MPPSLFVQNLERLKTESGQTWREIGQGLGHQDSRYILALRAGTYEPRQATIRRLADYFSVPESYFSEEHS